MTDQNIREQAEAFVTYAQKRYAWSLSATYQHWWQSKDFSLEDRKAIWREVKRITGSDEE
jgi:hypothetical protein